MFSLIRSLFRRTSTRPRYALLLQQQQDATVVQAIGPDVPYPDAKRMLLEALSAIEQQERAAQQQGRTP